MTSPWDGLSRILTRLEMMASGSLAQSTAQGSMLTSTRTRSTRADLPELPEGWEWQVRRVGGPWMACLFTLDVDCTVEVDGNSVRIITGVAPLEVVQAVIKANS